jgi:tetratricopeptide (TPR) repeat protein
LPIIQDLSRAYYHARRYDEAIATYLKALEIDPLYYRANSWLELAYGQKGQYDQAIEARLKAMSLIKVEPKMMASLREAYQARGWRGYWEKELEQALARPQKRPLFPYMLARTLARLGENDRALEWLEKAYEQRLDHLVLLKVDPLFDGLRSDPRFVELLRRVGLEQ